MNFNRPPQPDELARRAEKLGERFGEVIVQQRQQYILGAESDEPKDPTEKFESTLYQVPYFHFLHDETLAAHNVFPAWTFEICDDEDAGLLDSHNVHERLGMVDHARKVRERTVRFAAPALGFAAVELATQSPWEGTLGLIGGLVLSKVHRRKEQAQHLQTVGEEIRAIENEQRLSRGVVSLPGYEPPTVYSQYQFEAIKDLNIRTARSSVKYKAGAVLGWLQDHTKQSELYPNDMRQRHYGVDLGMESSGIHIKRHTSLWKLYLDAHGEGSFMLAESVDRLAADFSKANKDLAERNGLTLKRRTPQLGRSIFMGDSKTEMILNTKHAPRWKDAECAFVQLPAGRLLYQLLQQDHNPSEFFELVRPNLQAIQADTREQVRSLRKIRKIDADEQFTNVVSIVERGRKAELQGNLRNIEDAILQQTLVVAATAMHRNFVNEYSKMREELLNSMGEIQHADDQLDAIRLFDEGISALVQRLPLDSANTTNTGRRLLQYLKQSALRIDGSVDKYNQLYDGMRQKFPELQLK